MVKIVLKTAVVSGSTDTCNRILQRRDIDYSVRKFGLRRKISRTPLPRPIKALQGLRPRV